MREVSLRHQLEVYPLDERNAVRPFRDTLQFGLGRYAIEASKYKLSHGDDLKWRDQWVPDLDTRAELLTKLRQQIWLRRKAREGSASISAAELTEATSNLWN